MITLLQIFLIVAILVLLELGWLLAFKLVLCHTEARREKRLREENEVEYNYPFTPD